MYITLVKEELCDGQLQPGDLLVYSERGYDLVRVLRLDAGAIGMAALDGKTEVIYPCDTPSVAARMAVKLIACLHHHRPVSDPPPAPPSAGPRSDPSARPILHLLK